MTKRWSRRKRGIPAWSSRGTDRWKLPKVSNTLSLGGVSTLSQDSRIATTPLHVGVVHYNITVRLCAYSGGKTRTTYTFASRFHLSAWG